VLKVKKIQKGNLEECEAQLLQELPGLQKANPGFTINQIQRFNF